jgi:chromosome segregation ATPase
MHPALFAHILGRHAAIYAQHLGALLLRRHREIVDLERTALDLDHELGFVREPELAFWKVEVEARQAKHARLRRLRDLERAQAETAALRAAVDSTQRELDDTQSALAAAERERQASEAKAGAFGSELEATRREWAALQRDVGALRRIVEDLRTSWSWRLTAPLRALHALLGRPRR